MAWELYLWLLSFIGVLALIGFSAYQIICLADLEYDYINPYDTASRINAVVPPEFVIQGTLCILFFLTWHWLPFLIMAPVTYFHVKLYMKRQHLIDVTEIFRLLNGEKKYRMFKMAFYISLFVVVIYRLVLTAVNLLINEDGIGNLLDHMSY